MPASPRGPRRRPRRTIAAPPPPAWGQNPLRDRSVATRMARLAGTGPGPVLDLGAGDGVLTRALIAGGRPVVAVEIDPRLAAGLERRLGGAARVVRGDVRSVRLPPPPFDVCANLPFAITAEVLRMLLARPGWSRAVLLVQWEVARKRAAVGGTTLLTAAWWPWFGFELHGRVPARAFRPVPGVDGGILRLVRRPEPLVPACERRDYQRLVRAAFAGGGPLERSLRGVVARAELRAWRDRFGVPARARARDLDAAGWAALHRATRARTGAGRRAAAPPTG